MTEYCAVIGPTLYGATNCCKRSYQTPSFSCRLGCGYARLVSYSQKYWPSLNLVVWPQTKGKKIFGSGALQRIMSLQTLHVHFSGSVAVLSLEVLEQSREFVNLQEYNWQRASAKLAT